MKEIMNQPNLFAFATSELSHDAFIAWLLSWADPTFEDESMHSFSRFVLSDFFELTDKEMTGVQKVVVKTQYRNIDVLVLLTDKNGQRWAVIVENKIHTREHSKQLERYRENIHNDEDLSDITKPHILGIYYKMWEQSDIRRVNESDFSHFGRRHMLKLLEERYQTGTSDIVDHYEIYLKQMQENLDAYKTKKVKDWTGTQWTGFYSRLKQDLNDGDFGYVANPRGGFMGYWLGYQKIMDGMSIYVQSEHDKLCVKLNVKDKQLRQKAKWFWHRALIETAKQTDIEIVKPKVMRVGTWFTIGVLKTEEDEPWMALNKENKIDYDDSVIIIKKIIQIVNDVSLKKSDFLNEIN